MQKNINLVLLYPLVGKLLYSTLITLHKLQVLIVLQKNNHSVTLNIFKELYT